MNKKFVSTHGVKYTIHTNQEGKYALWMWSNKQSGWGWKGDFDTYEKAHQNMVSGAPGGISEE